MGIGDLIQDQHNSLGKKLHQLEFQVQVYM